MALRRVFVDDVSRDWVRLRDRQAHHLSRVARLRVGETVEISDRQRLFLATVKKSSGTLVEFQINQELEPPASGPSITLLLSIIKFARFEWAVEKATELGVSSIVPVAAERSERRLVQAAPRRIERWERIVEEAAQQARRLGPPEIERLLPFAEAVETCPAPLRLIFEFGAPALHRVASGAAIGQAQRSHAAILIGPEGGWEDNELECAGEAGFQAVGLGPLILRTETAALAALAVVSQVLHQNQSGES